MRRWIDALVDRYARRRAFVTAVQMATRERHGPGYEVTAIDYHTSWSRPSFFDVARAHGLDVDPANADAVADGMVALIDDSPTA